MDEAKFKERSGAKERNAEKPIAAASESKIKVPYLKAMASMAVSVMTIFTETATFRLYSIYDKISSLFRCWTSHFIMIL